MDSFEIIIKAVNDYINKAGVTSIDDFSLVKNLNDILLKTPDSKYYNKYKNKISLRKSIKIVCDFLNTINPEYVDYFKLRLMDGTIIFDYSNPYETAYSDYDEETKKRIIYIPVINNISDCHSIVHELMHDINLDVEQKSINRMLYTEGLSILGELLLTDYLKENKIKDYKIINNELFYAMKTKAIIVDFNLRLLEEYLRNNYIDKGGIIKVLESCALYYVDHIQDTVAEIVKNEELNLDIEQTYITGSLIAFYMYDRIKKSKKNINELFELNEMLKEYELENVLDYLDLSYQDGDLTKESYKKLELSYKNNIKRR